ncbi:phosphoribosylglycinamide formyltransferase [Scleromatobacter humisilvae]|uniref:Phosphoribosylglycinamide formyltransferase n=1 Tax=Scleromatobacter humisilvae TaxID=2897159 RepID=A0A9X1YPZ0_9BURK|nr:phosphoribosylglycinamide formyltransferase [Scleromatobacter humisilvae]MCK9689230.1 phosphoribosylglycinamide formyltransferase [Scleromatobacter humisilvae]
MKRIVVLISGQGSNLDAIVRASEAQDWPGRVVAVISNRAEARGLQSAQAHGIAAESLDHKAFADRPAFDAALAERIDRHAPDLVVLAGFMRILTPAFVARYEGRMLNIHPSLLPSFTGLNTHRRAIEEGCKVAGATVHFVSAQLDHGPIVAQAVVPVLAGDDEASLAKRVLAAEHELYPRAVGWFVKGELELKDGRVTHRGREPQGWLA